MATTRDDEVRAARSLTRETSLICATDVTPTETCVRDHLDTARAALHEAFLAARGLQGPMAHIAGELATEIDAAHIELMATIEYLETIAWLGDWAMTLGADGDLWVAPGHHSAPQMRAAVAVILHGCTDHDDEIADAPVTHTWVLDTSEWVQIVPPDTPGAEPATELDLRQLPAETGGETTHYRLLTHVTERLKAQDRSAPDARTTGAAQEGDLR